jgi:hypothetical protein
VSHLPRPKPIGWDKHSNSPRRASATGCANTRHATPATILFEIGLTLAAALSVALAGNMLASVFGS